MDWDSAYADEDYGISLDDDRYLPAPVECRQGCRCPRGGHERGHERGYERGYERGHGRGQPHHGNGHAARHERGCGPREGFVGAKIHDPEERAAIRAWRGAADPEGDLHYGGYPYDDLMPPRYADDTPYSSRGPSHGGLGGGGREHFAAGGRGPARHTPAPARHTPALAVSPQTLYFMLFFLVLVFLAVSLACLHRISALEAGITAALGTSK